MGLSHIHVHVYKNFGRQWTYRVEFKPSSSCAQAGMLTIVQGDNRSDFVNFVLSLSRQAVSYLNTQLSHRVNENQMYTVLSVIKHTLK